MFSGALAIVLPLIVTASYVIGFIYDASFLEEFGVSYYEMIGSPLDYLSIGGMYLLFSYSKNLSYLVFGLGITGICFVPLKRKLSRRSVEKYVDIESFPYVMFSLIPLFLLFFLPIVSDAKAAADEVKANKEDVVCLEGQQQCLRGSVLRYRESKVIFFDLESKETRVFPDRVVLSIKQG